MMGLVKAAKIMPIKEQIKDKIIIIKNFFKGKKYQVHARMTPIITPIIIQ